MPPLAHRCPGLFANMQACVSQVLPPSGVEHVASGHVCDPWVLNVVTASGSCVLVYRVEGATAHRAAHLMLLKRVQVEGTVSGIRVLGRRTEQLEARAALADGDEDDIYRTTAHVDTGVRAGRELDHLMVSFLDAKVSVLKYAPELQDFVTLSMHHFEKDVYKVRVRAHVRALRDA